MSVEQLRNCNIKKMGTAKGWCLANCNKAYDIHSGHYASAKSAMEAAKKNGTFHAGRPPKNVAVPVYMKTTSKYGHVVISYYGTFYTDGRKYNPSDSDIIGWDELMDTVRVVKSVSQGFLPTKGYWGRYDKDDRIAHLASFMFRVFPAYTNKKALGPIYGDNLFKSIKEFQRRSNGRLYPDGYTGEKTYNELKKYGFKY